MDPLVPPAHSPQRPKRTPRARGFRLLLVALPVGVLAYLLMTPAAIRVYGPYLSRSVFETLAYADVIILSFAVGYTLAALVPVVTGKTLEEASHDWDQLDGAERGFLGCGMVALVAFLVFTVGSFIASLP